MKKIIYLIIILLIIFICENVYAYDYKVGDKVRYRETIFYIINVDNNANTLTLLKAEPLTVEEVNTYGKVGTSKQHINMYMNPKVSSENYKKPINQSGYGGVSFLSSKTCGFDSNNKFKSEGCTTNYDKSDVKYVVNAWAKDKMTSKKVKETRLATVSEISSLGYNFHNNGTILEWKRSSDTPKWAYSENYWYWLMNEGEDYAGVMTNFLYVGKQLSSNYKGVIRPLVVIYNNDSYDNSGQSEANNAEYPEEYQTGNQDEFSGEYQDGNQEEFSEKYQDGYPEEFLEEYQDNYLDGYEEDEIYEIEDDEENYDLYDERDISDLYDENGQSNLKNNKTKKTSKISKFVPIILIAVGIIIIIVIILIVIKKKGAGDKT